MLSLRRRVIDYKNCDGVQTVGGAGNGQMVWWSAIQHNWTTKENITVIFKESEACGGCQWQYAGSSFMGHHGRNEDNINQFECIQYCHCRVVGNSKMLTEPSSSESFLYRCMEWE